MKISNIDLSNYPNSQKIYVAGKIYPSIRVAMRQIKQYPTVTIVDGKRHEEPNEPVTVYDTSGMFTDQNYNGRILDVLE